jgi:hypothetical protein
MSLAVGISSDIFDVELDQKQTDNQADVCIHEFHSFDCGH